jgi:ribose transport system permease protein
MLDQILPTRHPLLVRIPGVVVMLAVLSIGFAWASPGFLSWPNLSNVLAQSSVLLLIALPMTLVIMTEGLDLSIGAVLSLASVSLALVAVTTGSLLLALLVGVATGAACGAVNGWLVAWLRIPPFVATLGMFGVAQGLALAVSDGQSITGIPTSVQAMYSGTLAGIPVPILLMLAATLAMHALLYATPFGTYVFALGGNREALAFAGISQRRVLLCVYTLAGAMGGLAGLLLTARLNSGHPSAGIGMEFDAIAAVAVGGTTFERGNGWLPGTVLGVITIGVLRNGLNLIAVPSSLQVCCIGILVILAFVFEAFTGERTGAQV